MLDRVYREADRFDIIHCHTDYLGLPLTRHVATPTVLTLHGRLDLPDVVAIYRRFPHVPLVSISASQRLPMPDAAWVRTVHHGVPGALYHPAYAPGSYLLFVGRLAEEKRPDSAIAIARAAGMPLKIAAKVDPADQVYFERVVRPLLDDPLVEYLGEVDDAGKGALLRGAAALLFPIDWPEPFGLIMIEALACGTPVITRRRGSVPEVIEHGVTGFVCETDAEMARAVGDIATLDRRACRAEFERRFTVGTMARAYLEVYDTLLGLDRRGRGRKALSDSGGCRRRQWPLSLTRG